MYPEPIDKKYRSDINSLIKQKTDDNILGPLNGVTTRSNGNLLYAPELACGISASMWLYLFAKDIYSWMKDELDFNDGSQIAPDIDLSNQRAIVQKYINKKQYDFTDQRAYFSEYTFIRRSVIKEALLRFNDTTNTYCRSYYAPLHDELYNVVQNIIERVFA